MVLWRGPRTAFARRVARYTPEYYSRPLFFQNPTVLWNLVKKKEPPLERERERERERARARAPTLSGRDDLACRFGLVDGLLRSRGRDLRGPPKPKVKFHVPRARRAEERGAVRRARTRVA